VTFTVRHDVDGPRVRLGVAWFAVIVVACVLSPLALAVVLAIAAALAADQVVTLHAPDAATVSVLEEPRRLSAMLGAGALPLAASQGVDTLTGALAVLVVLTFIATRGRGAVTVLASASLGGAAAAPLLLHRMGMAAALVLLLLVAAYDLGDFVVGTGASTPWEGPAAGAVAVVVVGFVAVVLGPPPLREDGALAMLAVVALLAPLGPPVASVLVGDGVTPARFVRRLDSLLVAGPVAAYALAALR
jgi:hypothetical protein